MTPARTRLPLVYRRRPTRVVHVGTVGVGGSEPIRVQSMTTTDTGDVEGTALQTQRLAEAGCEIVRVTVPNMNDAAALPALRQRLEQLGVTVPLVADIHFNPHAAMVAADCVEKVRVNPGNYADTKRFAVREYSDDEYRAELDRIREKFHPLVEKCKRLGRSMRIGTNHGSLSDRIMNRYGDTPLGMVESALEFVRLCEELDYRELVISMKSSNPFVAVRAYRLLADRMTAEGMDYPFHLGVTEAGFGEDGRMKSAIGIGSLLADGIGDTIRVSLTEDPVREVPVAQALAAPYNWKRIPQDDGPVGVASCELPEWDGRRPTDGIDIGLVRIGGGARVSAWLSAVAGGMFGWGEVKSRPDAALADGVFIDARGSDQEISALQQVEVPKTHENGHLPTILACDGLTAGPRGFHGEGDQSITESADLVLFEPAIAFHEQSGEGWEQALADVARSAVRDKLAFGILLSEQTLAPGKKRRLTERLADMVVPAVRIALEATGRLPLLAIETPPGVSPVHAVRLACSLLEDADLGRTPILLVDDSALWKEVENLTHLCDEDTVVALETAVRVGGLLVDGIGDALLIRPKQGGTGCDRAMGVLQVTRLRMTRPDYIACPSCGRTLFDLEEVTARIKAVTSHLVGVKIAIMGCIVNGPGEMADADFGYVGSSPGKINLYVGKDCVEKNVPSADAERRLVELIKTHGRWVEPAVGAARE